MRVVGIVCEGRTDLVLLEQVVLATLGTVDEFRHLQPMHDGLHWSPGGWDLVRQWCARGIEEIADEMAAFSIDLLVIHVDGDMCGREGLPETRAELCGHVKSAWLGGEPRPGMIICIPAPATDVWLAAALDPRVDEDEPDPVGRLVQLGILRERQLDEKAPRKNHHAYREHGRALRDTASDLRWRLPELHRFMTKLEAWPAK